MFSEHTQGLLEQPMVPPQEETRELTLEEAISVAILLQKNEQLTAAEAMYRRVGSTRSSSVVLVERR